jgi:hypothetical protein
VDLRATLLAALDGGSRDPPAGRFDASVARAASPLLSESASRVIYVSAEARGESRQTPQFPRLTSAEGAIYKREHKQKTWVGGVAALKKIQQTVEDLLEREFLREVTTMGPAPVVDDYGAHERAIERITERYRLSVRVSGKDGRWENTGDLASSLQGVKLDEIDRITITNSWASGSSRIDLTFQDSAALDGVKLVVSGADEHWVTGAFNQLKELLQDQRPKWAAFRNMTWPIVVTGFFFNFAVQLLLAITPDQKWKPSSVTAAIFIGSAAYVGMAWLLERARRWALPSLDVYRDGEMGRSGKRIKAVGAIVSFLLASVVIPALFLLIH